MHFLKWKGNGIERETDRKRLTITLSIFVWIADLSDYTRL